MSQHLLLPTDASQMMQAAVKLAPSRWKVSAAVKLPTGFMKSPPSKLKYSLALSAPAVPLKVGSVASAPLVVPRLKWLALPETSLHCCEVPS
jgi:hypothetical protein